MVHEVIKLVDLLSDELKVLNSLCAFLGKFYVTNETGGLRDGRNRSYREQLYIRTIWLLVLTHVRCVLPVLKSS